MISRILILSQHQDVIIEKDYRLHSSEPRISNIVLKERLEENKRTSSPPHFQENGVTYIYIRRNSLYFMATTNAASSPIYIVEFLDRLYHILKDFCGVVNEDSLQANIILIYEILEEVIDFGQIQIPATEKIKPYIQSEAVVLTSDRSTVEDITSRLFGIDSRRVSSSAANKPVIPTSSSESKKYEIFLDVIEKITTLVQSNLSTQSSDQIFTFRVVHDHLELSGRTINPGLQMHRLNLVCTSQKDGRAVVEVIGIPSRLVVTGCVNMKNLLPSSAQVKVLLNDDLTISTGSATKGIGVNVHLDNCKFHKCVKLDNFEKQKQLFFQPPTGETTILNYSLSTEGCIKLPFILQLFLEDIQDSRDSVMVIKLRSTFSSHKKAAYVTVTVPVPSSVTSVSQHLSGDDQTAELNREEKKLIWKTKNFPGSAELASEFRLISYSGGNVCKQDIGPARLDFEISGFSSSGLQLKFVKVLDRDSSYVPYRYVRHITVSDSYIVKSH